RSDRARRQGVFAPVARVPLRFCVPLRPMRQRWRWRARRRSDAAAGEPAGGSDGPEGGLGCRRGKRVRGRRGRSRLSLRRRARALVGSPGQSTYWVVGSDLGSNGTSGAAVRHPAEGVLDAYQVTSSAALNGVAVFPDGSLLAVGDRGSVQFLDAGSLSFASESN